MAILYRQKLLGETQGFESTGNAGFSGHHYHQGSRAEKA